MASKNIKGIKIEIGAETKGLDKALSDVNRQATSTAKELREVNNALKFNPGNTTLLAQKQKLLGDQISTTKDKLDRLKEAEKQVQAQFEKGDIGEEQYRAFQREIIETESKLKNYENQLKQTKNAQSQLGISLEKLGTKLKDVGAKLKDVGTSLTQKVTLPIAGAGVAAFKFAADLEDAMGASDQIFKSAANEVKTWADSLEGYYGIAESEALTYANTMGAMLQNIGGLSEQEAAKQSQILVQLAGDLTAMFGGTTESAVQALTGALKGNTAMLDNYGMGVNDATIKTKALEMGLYSGKGQMDLSAKQAATLALIMEQTADAQGQAAREADGASGSLRTLGTELKNIAGDLGEILMPMLMPLIEKLKELVGKFKELSPEQQENIVKIGLMVAALGPLLAIIGKVSIGIGAMTTALGMLKLAKIKDIAQTTALNALYIKDAVVKGASTVATGAMTVATGAWNIVAGIATGVTSALGAAIAFLTSPIGLAILAIAAIIAIGVLLYKNWDTVKAKVGELASVVSSKFSEIKNNISDKINAAKDAVKGAIDKIKGFFNFNFKWPKLSIPKFSVSPPGWKIGDLLKGSIPKLDIAWNAEGGIFNRPTVLPTMAGLQGFAEPRTGGEAIMPLSKLPNLMADAMRQVGGIGDTVINVYNPQPSPSELARQIKKSQRDLALGW